jgi:RNA polymerase-binding transcription factor DksA
MKKDKARHFKYLLDHHREDREEVIDDMEGAGIGEYDPFYRDELSHYDNHPAEFATELFEMEHYMALKKLQTDEVRKIRQASAKVDEGTYGICEACGKDIDNKRLEVLPQASLCIDCAVREENETLSIKEQTMKKRHPEEQILDASNLNRDGVHNQALEDLMHYGSSSELE